MVANDKPGSMSFAFHRFSIAKSQQLFSMKKLQSIPPAMAALVCLASQSVTLRRLTIVSTVMDPEASQRIGQNGPLLLQDL